MTEMKCIMASRPLLLVIQTFKKGTRFLSKL